MRWERGCWASFVSGVVLVGVCWASFVPEMLLMGVCWANFFAEESLKALMVNVCMCARSPCGRWSGLVLWAGCFEGCWLLLVVLCPLARVLVG